MTQTQLDFTAADRKRLGDQQRRVVSLMADGAWRTLAEISAATGAPEASASARLRAARQMGWEVLRERVAPHRGLYRYRIQRAS